MGFLGSVLGRVLTLGVAAVAGFAVGGPAGAGLAMANAAVASHTAGLVGLLAPL